jgi:hypothetical protein
MSYELTPKTAWREEREKEAVANVLFLVSLSLSLSTG